VLQLLVTGNVVPCSPILLTLTMEAVPSTEMSVVTRVTRRNIPEDSILHSDRRGKLKALQACLIWGILPKNFTTARDIFNKDLYVMTEIWANSSPLIHVFVTRMDIISKNI
jgi:hypothetical protein